MDLNVLAVRRIIEFCKTVKDLKSVVHISTAYAHTNRDFIEERVYDPAVEPQRLIDLTANLDDDMAEAVTPHFLGVRPNSYTFTKSIAEVVMATEGKDLPAVIVRPSIVSCTWKDPLPGWVDNYNGPVGVIYAIGTGMARVFPGDKNLCADVVPVDIAANYTIGAAWYAATRLYPNVTETPVFNCTVSGQNPAHWDVWEKHMVTGAEKYPLDKRCIRTPAFKFIPSTSPREYAVCGDGCMLGRHSHTQCRC